MAVSQLGPHVRRKLLLLDSRVSAALPGPGPASPEQLLARRLARQQSSHSAISGYGDMFGSTSLASTHSSASSDDKSSGRVQIIFLNGFNY